MSRNKAEQNRPRRPFGPWASVGVGLLSTMLLVCAPARAQQEPARGHGSEQRNMRLVGAHDLQGRAAYQPLPIRQGDRYVLYVGHHVGRVLNSLSGDQEVNGTSVLDVTDPRRPFYLRHIPATGEAQSAQHVRVCDGADLPRGDAGTIYLLRTNDNESHEVWDVTDPQFPSLVTTVVSVGRMAISGDKATHKSAWDCETGIAYLVSSVDDWRAGRILQVFDLGDPAAPVHVRDYSLVGVQPDASGPVPGGSGVHEPVVFDDRLYLSYGTSNSGVMQLLDRDRLLHGDPAATDPFAPTPANLRYPEIARLDMPSFWGAHTAWPLLDMDISDYAGARDGVVRDFLVLVSESVEHECQEIRHAAFMVDITDEARPFPVSTFQVPEASGNFCDRGGRFGPHGFQESRHPLFFKKLVFFSWFNAGVRAVDVRDPFRLQEVGFYIPATTEQTAPRCVTINGEERCKIVIQTNNVEVDDRGFIYLVDRANTGLHIVELTGQAREIADRR